MVRRVAGLGVEALGAVFGAVVYYLLARRSVAREAVEATAPA